VERVKAIEAGAGLHCSDGRPLSVRDALGREQFPERLKGGLFFQPGLKGTFMSDWPGDACRPVRPNAGLGVMTEDEAISRARNFVRSKYGWVPRVAHVQHCTERYLRMLQKFSSELKGQLKVLGLDEPHQSASWSDSETSALSGKWVIAFHMSWETDAA